VEPVQAIETAPCCASCTYENASGRSHWKVYGPDLNGHYGSLQGTGGLEATILDFGGTTQGVINDQFGNGVASVTGSTATWFATRVGAYGPLPGTQAATLTDITQLAASTAWRGRRIDPTGFYDLGARYYEPTSGRFLSADPMGQAASPSLYDYAGGDPVNFFDPDGRCPDNSNRYPNGLYKPTEVNTNGAPAVPIGWGQNSADPNPVYAGPGLLDGVLGAAFQNLSIVAGGSVAEGVGVDAHVSHDVNGGSAAADAVLGFGAAAYAGVQGTIGNSDPTFSVGATGGLGVVAGVSVGFNIATVSVFGADINVPYPSGVTFTLGVGAGGEAKVGVAPSANVTTVNVSNNGTVTTGAGNH